MIQLDENSARDKLFSVFVLYSSCLVSGGGQRLKLPPIQNAAAGDFDWLLDLTRLPFSQSEYTGLHLLLWRRSS